MRKFVSPIFLILFLGLLLRLIFVPAAGFEADIAYWKWWAEAASHGPANALNTTGINYPPFFIYVLGGIWKVYEIFKPLETTNNLFQTNTFIFLLIMKLPAILSDLFIGWGIYWLCRQSAISNQQSANNKSVNRLIGYSVNRSESNNSRGTCGTFDTRGTSNHVAMQPFSHSSFVNRLIGYSVNRLSLPLLASALYLFNPVVIFDSAFWGQTDSIAAALVIACLILLLKNKIFFCVALSVIALETKVQTVIFLPFLYLLILRWYGGKKLFESFSIAAGTFFIINLPYILTNNLLRAVNLITESSNYFPLASLNAYNFWWLIAKGDGFNTPDSILVTNTFTYKSLGLFFFAVVYALLAIYLWINAKRRGGLVLREPEGLQCPPSNNSAMKPACAGRQCNNETINNPVNRLIGYSVNRSDIFISSYLPAQAGLHVISLVCTAAAFAFFMLPTQIHERYIFPIFVFLPLVFTSIIARGTRGTCGTSDSSNHLTMQPFNHSSIVNRLIGYSVNRFNILFILYYLFITVSVFLNLHLVLILNYPQNGLPLLDFFNKPGIYLPTTIIISWINVFLFLALLFYIVKKLPLKIIIAMFFISLICLVGPLLLTTVKRNQPVVSLSSLKPSFARQDWGKLQINKTVDKRLLSSTYVWYKEGLGTHANSQIEYNLNGNYKKFTTDIGIDTEAGDQASVEFIIKLDDRQIYKSGIMKKWTFPQHLEIPVENVKKLTLIVTDGGDTKNGDHADWLNPKLYR